MSITRINPTVIGSSAIDGAAGAQAVVDSGDGVKIGFRCALEPRAVMNIPTTSAATPVIAISVPASPAAIPASAIPLPRSAPRDCAIALRAVIPIAIAGNPVTPQVTRLKRPSTSDATARPSLAGGGANP